MALYPHLLPKLKFFSIVTETDFHPDAEHGSQGPNLHLRRSPRPRSETTCVTVSLCFITPSSSRGFVSACVSFPKTSLICVKLLKELTGVARILNVCAERSEDHTEYVPILCEALQICRYDE